MLLLEIIVTSNEHSPDGTSKSRKTNLSRWSNLSNKSDCWTSENN